MNQISQSNPNVVNLEECTSNKVSLETELSETLYNTMKYFVLIKYRLIITIFNTQI